MKSYLKKLPSQLQEIINVAKGLSFGLGFRAYLVGGFVRDIILGVSNFDMDIVVEGNGLRFAEELSSKLSGKLTRHRRFGTGTVITADKLKIDVATARKEIYAHPAALPIVSPGSIKDDLARRDFTINAMAISIGEEDFGSFIDFFSGQEDLSRKFIRVLHDLSFIDDPTRILRAIRFQQRYGLRIEPHTLRLFKESLGLCMLERVDKQRIRDEIILLLKEGEPLKYIRSIKHLTGFSFINHKIKLDKKKTLFLQSAARRISWFTENFPRKRLLDTWLIYFTVLLDGLSKREAGLLCRKLALRLGDTKRILSYKSVARYLIIQLSKREIPASKIYRLLESLSYEVIILISAKARNPTVRLRIEDFLKVYNGMRLHITGEDLKSLGVKPSPYFKKILTRALYAKIDNRFTTKEEELEFARGYILKYRHIKQR